MMMRATTTTTTTTRTTTAALEGRGFLRLFSEKKSGEREERFSGQRGGGEDVFFTRGGRRGRRRRRGSELRPFAARGDGGQKGVLSSGEYSFSSAAIAREIGEEDAEEELQTSDVDESEEDNCSSAEAEARHYKNMLKDSANRPTVKNMLRRIDATDPLGVDMTLRGCSSRLYDGILGKKKTKTKTGGAGGALTVYDFARQTQEKHPQKILLIRVGDFYECFGWNAVCLVAHAGLNPMGNTGVPRAGCPKNKVQETLDRLTSHGHSVVVCEEVPQMVKYGTLKAPPKDRFVSAIVTPRFSDVRLWCGRSRRGC